MGALIAKSLAQILAPN